MKQTLDQEKQLIHKIGYGIYFFILIAFIVLALGVRSGSTLPLDEAILKSINQWSSQSFDRAILFLTTLAGPILATTIGVLLFIFFLIEKKKLNSLYVVLTMAGTFLINTGLKLYFGRTRPALWPALVEEGSHSFPSGHSMISMAIALTVVILFYNSKFRRTIIVLGIVYVTIIGFTRLYLGVHYPSDVLGGWLASILWVSLVSKLMLRNKTFRQNILS